MPSLTQPHHVYVDLDVLNNDFSSGAQPHRLEFEETRNTPFLDGDSSNYFCSIVRFNIQAGSSLPVFIPRIDNPAVDPNETIYKVTLYRLNKHSTVSVIYNPGDNMFSLLKVGGGGEINTAPGGSYYYVKNYQDFVEMVNQALLTAYNNLVAQFPAGTFSTTTAPYLEMDYDKNKFILNAEINFYKQDQLNPILITSTAACTSYLWGFQTPLSPTIQTGITN